MSRTAKIDTRGTLRAYLISSRRVIHLGKILEFLMPQATLILSLQNTKKNEVKATNRGNSSQIILKEQKVKVEESRISIDRAAALPEQHGSCWITVETLHQKFLETQKELARLFNSFSSSLPFALVPLPPRASFFLITLCFLVRYIIPSLFFSSPLPNFPPTSPPLDQTLHLNLSLHIPQLL